MKLLCLDRSSITRSACGVVLLLLLMGSWPSSAQPAQPTQPADPQPVQGDTRAAAEVLEPGDTRVEDDASPWPDGSERWLFNADERTRAGRDALGSADADRAVERFDTALRLQPDDPVAHFNAGTARLSDQRPGARELLEAAAREAPERLKAPASYNLGNARLAAGDLPGALAAYEDALRADPGFADAKHNLEVALRRLQEQQQQNQDPQQNPDQQQQDSQQQEQNQDQQQGDPQQDQEQQEPGGQEPEEQEEEEDRQQNPEQDESQDSGGAGQGSEESPLPQFEDLPDMTAEEAAAILEAIQNMERQDRREQALEAVKKAQASGKKDW